MTRNARIKKPDEARDVGRPSKFTAERCAKIIHDISIFFREGNNQEQQQQQQQ